METKSYTKIYIIFFSTKEEPNYELVEVYKNETDAYERRDELLNMKHIYAAYVHRTIMK